MTQDSVPISGPVLAEIGARHGLQLKTVELLPSTGLINRVLALDDSYVLRLPHDHPAHIAQAVREAMAIPVAVNAGVRTAALVAFDDSCELVPVPYLIVERLHGVDAESWLPSVSAAHSVWLALGRDLARLHTERSDVVPSSLAETSDDFVFDDPRTLVDARTRDGWISPLEARWLAAWLDQLADAGTRVSRPCVVHGDVQMSNVLVGENSYEALIDWGCARLDDPVADFLAIPMAAVPSLLSGHRQLAPLPDDDEAETRILWRRLQMLLAVLPRGAAPGASWGERPVGWLVDLLRFFANPACTEPWRTLAPPRM